MHQLKDIVKIKNCPSFIDFSPSEDLPDFARYNLFYGWNGAGKTSFSRILRAFELGQISASSAENSAEFKFRLDDNRIISHDTLSSFKDIRVFNKDFIDETIFCDGGPKPIFYLGKENKEGKEEIVLAESELTELIKSQEKNADTYKHAIKDKDKLLKTKAQEIKNALTTSLNDKYRNYDSRDIQEQIGNTTLHSTELTDERVAEIKRTISQTVRVGISHLSVPDLDITSIQTKINNIIGKTVISKVIQKLKEDTEIAKWVEKGLNLHKDKALNKCAFCDQMIPLDRLNDLAQHFNEGYRHIVNAIQELKRECNSRRITIGYPEAITLYEELSQEYLKAKNSAEQTTVAFNNTLDSFISILEQKEQNAFLELKPITCDQLDNTPFTTINKIIDRHNEKTNNFELRIKNDKKDLELHHISQFLSLHDEKGLQSYKTASENSDQALKAKEKEIEQLKTTMLSHKIAVEQINKDLKHFLGRDDLQIKGLDTPGGYQVSRNGKAACNLSEGERTAIAIVYFLAKLGESSFSKENGVIVIDDPISSLDSNATFQAFSFIRKSIQDAGQIFILTHNFDFFKRVRNWFVHEDKANPGSSNLFMISCQSKDGIRKSSILKLDRLLAEYESEYHYLFSLIYCYANDKECELHELYPIPNIARKFLESFLAFRVPLATLDNSYQKLEKLNKADPIKKTRVLDFLATHSHARYESGVQDIDMTILGETHAVMNDLLDIVKAEDKDHFDFLLQSIKPPSI